MLTDKNQGAIGSLVAGNPSPSVGNVSPLDFSLSSRGLTVFGHTKSVAELRAYIAHLQRVLAFMEDDDDI